MAVAAPEREYMDIEVDCPGCGGKGVVIIPETRITSAALPTHMREHAYVKDIGANCDCPRRTKNTTRTCINCSGRCRMWKHVPIPKPGDKVTVVDRNILSGIFGEGQEPDAPGRVYDIQMPEEHHLELRSGLGVRVTWDRLTKDGKIPKGKHIELWIFCLLEVKLA